MVTFEHSREEVRKSRTRTWGRALQPVGSAGAEAPRWGHAAVFGGQQGRTVAEQAERREVVGESVSNTWGREAAYITPGLGSHSIDFTCKVGRR